MWEEKTCKKMAAEIKKGNEAVSIPGLDAARVPHLKTAPPIHPIWCQPSLRPLGLATSLEKNHSTPFLLLQLSSLPITEACKHEWTDISWGREHCSAPGCTVTAALVSVPWSKTWRGYLCTCFSRTCFHTGQDYRKAFGETRHSCTPVTYTSH